MSTSFEQYNKLTEIVADTADFIAIRPYSVSEATTNPIVILQAATSSKYQTIVQQGVEYGMKTGKNLHQTLENAIDMINVLFGVEILNVVKEKVHIQIDPRLAFDTKKSVARAVKIVGLFAEKNITKQRVVIKLPATWEGIQAAKILERDYKINCNMTTVFTLVQAAVCAEAGASYVAPFVGRINLWHQEKSKPTMNHEGVETLKLIQSYFRKFSYKTKVMGAYFVNLEEVMAVAGCDMATLSVELLDGISKSTSKALDQMEQVPKKLQTNKMVLSESEFRWLINENVMATELLSEILRVFANHFVKLECIVKDLVMVLNSK